MEYSVFSLLFLSFIFKEKSKNLIRSINEKDKSYFLSSGWYFAIVKRRITLLKRKWTSESSTWRKKGSKFLICKVRFIKVIFEKKMNPRIHLLISTTIHYESGKGSSIYYFTVIRGRGVQWFWDNSTKASECSKLREVSYGRALRVFNL